MGEPPTPPSPTSPKIGISPMLELSPDDDVFTFTHGGTEYHLPALTIDDVETVGELITLPHAQMARKVRDYIVDIAEKDHPETAHLISRLGLKNFFLVFRMWSGMELGESKPSDES